MIYIDVTLKKICLPTTSIIIMRQISKRRMIALCYGSVPNKYRFIDKPPNGDADHNTVNLFFGSPVINWMNIPMVSLATFLPVLFYIQMNIVK